MAKKIKDTEYLAISTRIRAMENGLLTREKMEQVLDARTDDEAVKILDFERNFWRIPCRCGGDSRLSPEVMEKLRPYWERRSRTPVFVSLDAGTLPPDGELIEELTCLIRDFRSGKNEGGLC